MIETRLKAEEKTSLVNFERLVESHGYTTLLQISS